MQYLSFPLDNRRISLYIDKVQKKIKMEAADLPPQRGDTWLGGPLPQKRKIITLIEEDSIV
jgi:hypothetical protein